MRGPELEFRLLIAFLPVRSCHPAGSQAYYDQSPSSETPTTGVGDAWAGCSSDEKHVVIVMLENLSYNQVVGNSNAPYQTSPARQCGVAPDYFAATHTSAANYLAVSAGQYPPASPPGCGSVPKCANPEDNIYHQLNTAGLSWGGYMESMPVACDPKSSGTNTSSHDLYDVGPQPCPLLHRHPRGHLPGK